eukprot:CAMPEP_0119296536 /NCGR_PEP_ID=MMETSP1329-20130426/50621_1 /TAXON_ID=114041 /ORGANISM="Genus nov. species nov., Strain RCC1024" /LENGTH=652 /DNA_ID=CAMNT_0007297471 /DNA_START=302 /DNA_END=2256 /DNA_ORIENTATION=+
MMPHGNPGGMNPGMMNPGMNPGMMNPGMVNSPWPLRPPPGAFRRREPPLNPGENETELYGQSARTIFMVLSRFEDPSPLFLVKALHHACKDRELREAGEDADPVMRALLEALAMSFDPPAVPWTPKLLSIMATSLASVGARGEAAAAIRRGVVAQTAEIVHEFDQQALCMTATAFARCVRVFDGEQLFAVMAPRISQLLPDFERSRQAPRDVANLAWAYAKSRWPGRSTVILSMAQAALHFLPRFNAQDLSNTAHALAALDSSDAAEAWFAAVPDRCPLRSLIRASDVREHASLARAFATRAPIELAKDVVLDICEVVRGRHETGTLGLVKAQEACVLAQSLGTLVHRTNDGLRGGRTTSQHLMRQEQWRSAAKFVFGLAEDICLALDLRDVIRDTVVNLAIACGGAQVPSRFFAQRGARVAEVLGAAPLKDLAISLTKLVIINPERFDDLRRDLARRPQLVRMVREAPSDGVAVLWALSLADAPVLEPHDLDAYRGMLCRLWETLQPLMGSLDEADRSQLQQVWLSLRYETPALAANLSPPPACWARAVAARGARVSNAQREFARTLRSLGIAVTEEHDVCGSGVLVDAADVEHGVAYEYDGPQHFLADRSPTGRTRFKRRLIRAMGWRLVAVPCHEWDEAPSKEVYIRLA